MTKHPLRVPIASTVRATGYSLAFDVVRFSIRRPTESDRSVGSCRRARGRGRAAVFAAFLAAIPIYASVTEQHHLVAELLVYALLAPSLIPGSRPWWLAAVAYPFLWISHDDPFRWAIGLP